VRLDKVHTTVNKINALNKFILSINTMEIICDDREKHVFPFMEDLSHKFNINYKITRLEVGDYAICYKDVILLIIERKTWCDLAASMRDGRKGNIAKLISLREEVNCHIAYLIEGDPFPRPDKTFSRNPAKYLRAHLDHIAFRDNVHMLYSKNQEATAYRLFELSKNYSTNKTIIKAVDEKLSIDNEHVSQVDGSNEKSLLLLKKKRSTSTSIQEKILRCLPHVGSIISTLLVDNSISIYDFYADTISADIIACLKYPTGSMIGLDKGLSIYKNRFIFTSESQKAKKIQLKILSCIPMVSTTRAEKILEYYSFADLFTTATIDELSEIKLGKNKLGVKLATDIITSLQLTSQTSQTTNLEAKPDTNADTRQNTNLDVKLKTSSKDNNTKDEPPKKIKNVKKNLVI